MYEFRLYCVLMDLPEPPSTIMHLLLVAVLAASQTPTFVDTYSTAELERASRTYHDNLVGSWEEDLLPRLTPAQRGAASTVSLRLPLLGAGRNPYDFYASPTARVVTIPILSVKFLDDLAIAATWYEVRGCSMDAVSDYAPHSNPTCAIRTFQRCETPRHSTPE